MFGDAWHLVALGVVVESAHDQVLVKPIFIATKSGHERAKSLRAPHIQLGRASFAPDLIMLHMYETATAEAFCDFVHLINNCRLQVIASPAAPVAQLSRFEQLRYHAIVEFV